jgi:mRNA interferase MazF
MATFSKSTIVIVPFPFTDLSEQKLRPALLLANAGKGDWILCQITSNPYADLNAVLVSSQDFEVGNLAVESYVRPTKMFTANQSIFKKSVARLTTTKHEEVVAQIVQILNR